MSKRLTFEDGIGNWGLTNYDIKKVPGELYGAICKLRDYEKLGSTPEELEKKLEKQTGMKPVVQSTDEKKHYECKCGAIQKTVYKDGYTLGAEQKIDWSK